MSGRGLGVALIGTGKMGRAHSVGLYLAAGVLDAPVKPVRVVACGRTPEQAEAFARRFGWAEAVTSWEEVVSRPDVDLVDVCVPNDLHVPVAQRALEAGKHVLVEKPLGRSSAEAEALCDLASKRPDQISMTVFNYRFVPAVSVLGRLVASGALGTLRQFTVRFFQDWLVGQKSPSWRLDPERAGSGVLGDLGVHCFDLVNLLVGGVESVCALTRSDVGGGGVEDSAHVLVKVQGGATGVVEVSRTRLGYKTDLAMELTGTEGSAAWRLAEPDRLRTSRLKGSWEEVLATSPEVFPEASSWWGAGHPLGFENSFAHLMAELLRAVAEGRPAEPGLGAGLAAQRAVDAALRSALRGGWSEV
jgi:predicted dehydrogenase